MGPITRLWSGKEKYRGAENVHRNSPDRMHDGSRNYGWYCLWIDRAIRGLHMGSHAIALSVNAFTYVYARRLAFSERFSFGTGKVNTLGGYTGAILLTLFALLMAWESCQRLLNPINIVFNQAIAIATVGLVVNGASVFILGDQHEHTHEPEYQSAMSTITI